jgi:hypothetical protein
MVAIIFKMKIVTYTPVQTALTSIVDYGCYETTNDLVKSVNAKLKKDNKNDNIK